MFITEIIVFKIKIYFLRVSQLIIYVKIEENKPNKLINLNITYKPITFRQNCRSHGMQVVQVEHVAQVVQVVKVVQVAQVVHQLKVEQAVQVVKLVQGVQLVHV